MENLTKRIIPCLDVKDKRVVKGINFVNLIDAGDPLEVAKRYNDEGADEICFLDITATDEKRKTIVEVIERVAKNLFIPLTVGGGIKNIDDVNALLSVGCDKISINSSAVNNPNLIDQIALKFGSQCVVVAIDVKRNKEKYEVFTNGGKKNSKIDAISWAKEAQERGAGEILLTSMDADGTKNGYDIDITKKISNLLKIPVIASGGAGKMQDIKEVFEIGADAALAASIFHFGEIRINELKKYLLNNNISVRI
ncbi:imidazole glycerol phosphate synthase subunit HisF [Campylobacter sp. FMV-PI01]|uniref:Imidazole glycerol phosphate synthase subunit HisF n=1 Tax=Campylobacter portucalensis TaxID=2608384 RepID=A0A6L5WG94_9BACT|nr:imidazole glycerol phosphate synthase subunit HisF [Campylobacter portucalensis]MSN95776.1 imidazole glycerol phosphate synthase subunit HisF [Campylobacter portucalensis]